MTIVVLSGYAESLLNFRGHLLREFVRLGHRVIACAPSAGADLIGRIEALGVTFRSVRIERAGLTSLADLKFLFSFWSFLRRERVDLLFSYTVKPVIYGSLAGRLAGVNEVYSLITGLGYSFTSKSWGQWLLGCVVTLLYRVALARNRTVFFQNTDDLEVFRHYRIVRERVVVVNGSGVDLAHFHKASPVVEPLSFLLVGRLLRDKGVVEFVDAARSLKARYPNVIFRLLGPFDENPSSIRADAVNEWRTEGSVDYLGAAEDVRPFLISASVCVLPSYREGTPRSVLEAMAMCRPIVTTDVPGCRETVRDGWNGFLVPARQVEPLARAMERFILHPDLIPPMGGRSRQLAEDKFDVHEVNRVIVRAMGLPRKCGIKLVSITTVAFSLRFLIGHHKYLKDHGYDVHAVSSLDPLLEQFAGSHGVKTHPVEMARRVTPLRDLVSVFRLWRLLKRLKPAIVHSHTPKGGLLGMLAAGLAGVPVRIYHIHGLPFTIATGWKRAVLVGAEKVASAFASQVLCVSHSIRQVAIENKLCAGSKIKVLGNGSIAGVEALGEFNPLAIDPGAGLRTRSAYGIPEAALVIGFIGRIVRDKGMIELAGAWRLLSAEFPELHLLLVGPFEPQDPIPPDTERVLREDPRVHLVGTQWDVTKFYAAMDIFCLPTYREGFPVVVLEAGAMALPCVSTKVPGCVDAIVDEVTGILAAPRDSLALASALRRYLKNPELRRQHGAAARHRTLREFDPSSMQAALLAEYERLLSRSN